MLKRLILIGLLLGLFLVSGLMYAKDAPKVNYTWTKIGDDFYEVWSLNEPLFVENVENYNQGMLNKALLNGEKFKSWDEIKTNRIRLGLRISNVKYRDTTGLIKVMDNKMFFKKLTYGNGKVLYIKGTRDREKVRIDKEDNAESPVMYASKNSNYFTFTDEEGIWGIIPIVKDTVSFEVVKLSADKVNGKTKSEINHNLQENQTLLWNEQPRVSDNGSYVAYLSNKNHYSTSTSDQSVFEFWVIDTKQKTDTMKFTEPNNNNLTIYSWMDDSKLIFSVNDDIYLFDAKDNTRSLLFKNAKLLNYSENFFAYCKNAYPGKIYLYNYKKGKETSTPIISQEALLTAGFLPTHYSISPNGAKLAALVCERTKESPNGKDMFYIFNNSANLTLRFDWPDGAKGGSLSKWLNNNELIVNTLKYGNGMEIINTWILTLNK